MGEQQNTSPVSSSSGTPPSSPPTDQSYQTPLVEQVTVLVPVPEDVQLPSPNTLEEEVVRVPPPRAPTLGHRVGGQRCWTRRKTDTEGKGIITQWVHGEFIVSFETICLVNTHQVCVEYF